ncbi:MAG: hypothetical protein FWG99_00835 [Treponema sp.]|nr:hypothetical protein [Treponema sp.]
MKKIAFFGLILVMLTGIGFFISCEGPEGPRGGRGNDAFNAAIKAEIDTYIDEVVAALGDLDGAVIDLYLPTSSDNGITVVWASSNPGVLGGDGQIYLPSSVNTSVTLTGFFSKGGVNVSQVFEVTVPAVALLTDEQKEQLAFNLEARAFKIDTFMDYYHYDIILPLETEGGSSVAWESSSTIYPILPDRVPTSGNSRVKVTDTTDFIDTIFLTANITGGGNTYKKVFPVQVVDRVYTGYLKATFLGSNPNTEHLFYALSREVTVPHDDPTREGWKIANEGIAIARSASTTGGVRDPFVQRHPNGTFVYAATDMHATGGNRAMVLGTSNDLINWNISEVDLNLGKRYPSLFNPTNVYAPCVIYDRREGKFLVTWSSSSHTGFGSISGSLMFYAYINDSFTDFETAPRRVLKYWTEDLGLGGGCIDISISYFNGRYYSSWRNPNYAAEPETGIRLGLATSSTINGGGDGMDWELIHKVVDYETYPIGGNDGRLLTEGPEWIRKIGTEEMVLFWDRHAGDMLDELPRDDSLMRFGYMSTFDFETWDKPVLSEDVGGFVPFQHYTMKTDYSANHASIIPLTEEEYQRILNHRGNTSIANNPTVTANATLALHYTFDGAAATPDTNGTDAAGTGSVIFNRAGTPSTTNSYNGKIVFANSGGVDRDLVSVNGIPAFYTGTSRGFNSGASTADGNIPAYIDMGADASSLVTDQNDFTIATYVKADDNLVRLVGWGSANNTSDPPIASQMNGHANLWSFANTTAPGTNAGGYIQYRATAQGYKIATENQNNMNGVTWGETLTTGKWYHIMYRQRNQWGTIYVDGVPVITSSTRIRTTDLASMGLVNNYIGRGPWANSWLMPNSYFADFRIYRGAISESQIAALNIPATLATLSQ